MTLTGISGHYTVQITLTSDGSQNAGRPLQEILQEHTDKSIKSQMSCADANCASQNLFDLNNNYRLTTVVPLNDFSCYNFIR